MSATKKIAKSLTSLTVSSIKSGKLLPGQILKWCNRASLRKLAQDLIPIAISEWSDSIKTVWWLNLHPQTAQVLLRTLTKFPNSSSQLDPSSNSACKRSRTRSCSSNSNKSSRSTFLKTSKMRILRFRNLPNCKNKNWYHTYKALLYLWRTTLPMNK